MITKSKKFLTIVAAAIAMAIFLAGSAFAEGLAASANNGGGFSGPGPDLVTVQQALTLGDDARVSLKGNIIKSLGDEMYLFQDASGSVEVEIDDDVWRGLTVTPEDVVVISGEIDKEWSHTSIDVSSVAKQ